MSQSISDPMKKTSLLLCFLFFEITTFACELCNKRQPKALRGITHGAGPESNWDYVIISVITIVVLISLFFSVKWLITPGETSEDHIKRSIFKV